MWWPSAVRAVLLFSFKLSAVLDVCVPFAFGVLARTLNWIVSVPNQYLFIYFTAVPETIEK